MAGINLHGETEESLIAALRQRKQNALRLLYDAYAPVYLGVISSIVKEPAVAEEVLKETFLAIWSRIAVYDPYRNRFLTWSLALARGIALEEMKTGKHRSIVLQPEKRTFVKEEETWPAELLQCQRVQEAFCQLEANEKAILDLLYKKGYTCRQAADQLGITEQALRTNLKQAFAHLGIDHSA